MRPVSTGIISVYFVEFWGLRKEKVRLFRNKMARKGFGKNLDGGFRHVCSSTTSSSPPKILCCCGPMRSSGESYKHLDAWPFLLF